MLASFAANPLMFSAIQPLQMQPVQVQPVQVPVQAIVNHPADIQVDIRTFSRVSLSPIWKTSRKVRGQRVLALSRLPELWPTLEGEG